MFSVSHLNTLVCETKKLKKTPRKSRDKCMENVKLDCDVHYVLILERKKDAKREFQRITCQSEHGIYAV